MNKGRRNLCYGLGAPWALANEYVRIASDDFPDLPDRLARRLEGGKDCICHRGRDRSQKSAAGLWIEQKIGPR
jgi:hypothetical protein